MMQATIFGAIEISTDYFNSYHRVTPFGGRKIPELMRGLGSGIKEFKKATKKRKRTVKKKVSRFSGG